MANGSLHTMAQVAEASYGVTPATPAFKPIRINSTTLGLSKNTLESGELRSDRNTADLRHGTMQVGGDIVSELSFGSFDDQLEALLCGTWAENVLLNGVERRSFSVLRHFGDIGKADKPYHLLTGCEYNTLNLQVTTEAIVQATFGIVGKGLALLAAAPAGATFADPTTTAPMDSFTGELVEGGKTISVVTEIQLTIENGISPKYVVGSKETIRPSIGRCKVTGQVSAYFEDSYLLEKFINEASSSLVFTLTDREAGNSMKFTIPKIKYTGGQPDVGDEGPITLSMPFQALLDSAAGGALKIERIAHA